MALKPLLLLVPLLELARVFLGWLAPPRPRPPRPRARAGRPDPEPPASTVEAACICGSRRRFGGRPLRCTTCGTPLARALQ